MKISKEQAKKVLDAFGPCTTLYECTTTEELIEEVVQAESLQDFICTQIKCEEIRMDRHCDVAYMEESSGEEYFKGKHQKVINESKQVLNQIKERCAALLEEIK